VHPGDVVLLNHQLYRLVPPGVWVHDDTIMNAPQQCGAFFVLHRIGQQRPVTIFRLATKATIEDKIVELHKHKRDLADNLLEGTESSARLSTEDILALLKDAQD
jgi:hypothetical protein